MSRHLPVRQIWGMPIVLVMLSAIGLLSALLGDGMWDMLSWLTLGAPLVVIVRQYFRS